MYISESKNKSNRIILISYWNFNDQMCNISEMTNLFNTETIKILILQIFTSTN